MIIILSNKTDTYLIRFSKEYDSDYLKFIVNHEVDKGKSISDILDTLQYNFDVLEVLPYDTIYKLWCM